MPVEVSVDEVVARWRPLEPAERPVAEALLVDARAILEARVPGLEDRLAAGTVSEALVRSVLTGMVLRVLRNPDGLVQETTDDYSYRRADDVATGALYVSDVELGNLTAATTPVGAGGGAYSVRPGYVPGWGAAVPAWPVSGALDVPR